ncbi:MAG: Rid family detoxifying hydrolase [Chloroflexota bacterium]
MAARQIIRPEGFSSSVPLSPGVRYGELIYTSGQVGTDPHTGALARGDITAQTEQTLRNVQAVLEAAGSSLDRVIKATCFLTDRAHFSAFNEVYRRFFPQDPPGRSTIICGLAAPDLLVEIEVIASV